MSSDTSRRRVGLIGSPLRRRHSKVMHDAAFDAAGVDARYELHERDADGLGAFVAGVREDPAWLGFQITAPHKQAVVPLLDDVDDVARRIGAVNSVARSEEGRLVGFNTDAPGFAAAVAADLDVNLQGADVVLVGAGGAARAVAMACAQTGTASLVIANRTASAAAELAAELPDATGLGLDDPRLPGCLRRADLLVNATTVGMTSGDTAVDPTVLMPGAAVFDLVYVPPVTPLLAAAAAHGLSTANGSGMLVAQAAIAWQRWTGAADPTAVMRPALDAMVADGQSP